MNRNRDNFQVLLFKSKKRCALNFKSLQEKLISSNINSIYLYRNGTQRDLLFPELKATTVTFMPTMLASFNYLGF